MKRRLLTPRGGRPRTFALALRLLALLGCCLGVLTLGARDYYLSPNGSGTRTGTTIADAAAAADGGLQRSWGLLAPGDRLVVVSGLYSGVTLSIHNGGLAGKPKTLCGRDTGGGLPVFVSDFDRTRTPSSGDLWLSVAEGASFLTVENVIVRAYRVGVLVAGGAPTDIVLRRLNVHDVQEGIRLEGADRVVIEDCEVRNYTRRGFRLKLIGSNIRVVRCLADAGGKAWATEPFQMGFQVDRTADGAETSATVTFEECTARNNYNDAGTGYWNGDGFCAEKGTAAVRYLRCRAFDNTDGGWDDKSGLAELENCVALRNKRNFRFWGGAHLRQCVGAYSVHPGGSGHDAGLWVSGRVVAEYCTFHENTFRVEISEQGRLELRHCILSQSESRRSGPSHFAEREAIKCVDTVLWPEGGAENDPQLVCPRADWDGCGSSFDSAAFGPSKGFNSRARSEKKKR